MAQAQSSLPPIRSARPELTAEITRRTGLTEAHIADLVERFYGKVRVDPVLGPIFAERIDSWAPHLERMVAFWSSVALKTGEYHGTPVPKHTSLPVTWDHFERWLALFEETAGEVCLPAGARHVVERAESIARSLHMAVQEAQHSGAPRLD